MSLMLRVVVAASLFVIVGQSSLRAVPGQNNDKDKEEKLIAKAGRENNPGKKARLRLRLAKLKLGDAEKAYHSRDFAQGSALLRQYLDYVRDSWAALQAADNGVGKHLRAFMDLEISLREDDRFLRDLSRRVPYPESETIEKVAKESSAVHNQVLEAIFPDGVPPRRKKKHPLPPRSAMPSNQGTGQS